MAALTSPTILATDFLSVVAERLPDAGSPVMPASPRLTPRQSAVSLLSLLSPTATGTARLCDFRDRNNSGQTMMQMLADDIADSIAPVRKPLHVGARPEPAPSWFVSENEARRLDRTGEMQFVPETVVLSAHFMAVAPIALPPDDYPLRLSSELLRALGDEFEMESLYAP